MHVDPAEKFVATKDLTAEGNDGKSGVQILIPTYLTENHYDTSRIVGLLGNGRTNRRLVGFHSYYLYSENWGKNYKFLYTINREDTLY